MRNVSTIGRCSRARRITVTALTVAMAVSDVANAQARPDSAPARPAQNADSTRVTLAPARAKQGSILRITIHPGTVRPDTASAVAVSTIASDSSSRTDTLAAAAAWTILQPDSLAIRGTLFGEPLHFLPADSGRWVAVGGIPVDAPRSAKLPLIIARGGAAPDTVIVQLDIARTAYAMEKLTVAPKFGQKPDSALAARIAREGALASAVSRRSHETPRLWTGVFSHPRQARVTSAFGGGREFNGVVQSRHMGLDLAGAVGAPVLAPDRGVVALIGEFYLAGNAVYIDHGAGLVTAYFHLSAVNVALGDTVVAGTLIGKVGATGRVTGPHLHWVARYGAVTIDPATLLELAPARREP
jgi:murein DD-endopeptidase MepM/ murein hydrolase activator NlpD